MALSVCKCLNVTLEYDKVEEIGDIGKLELSSTEQRDIFFSEKLVSCSIDNLKIQVAQPALVDQRTVGQWTLHSCLACGQTTHAISHDKMRPNLLLISKSTQAKLEDLAREYRSDQCKIRKNEDQHIGPRHESEHHEDGSEDLRLEMCPNNTSQDWVNNLKKSKSYSPVFNLLVPEVTNDIEMKENVDTNNVIHNDRNVWLPTQQVIGSLSKQLNQSLQSQFEAMQESVRQFTDQKYAEYEAYREKAHRDHKILASIVSKAQSSVDRDSWRVDASLDNGPLSPQLPPLQRRRLSSIKDAKKLSHNIVKPNKNVSAEEDSLDAEDLFDLEGMNSQSNMLSDQDDYDSDECSNDEGIHINRPRGAAVEVIARSLPMNMPCKVPTERFSKRDLDDEEEPEDIAASIKALARSVHGDVFELPRPRFSTQI